jgi:hypothetical protein
MASLGQALAAQQPDGSNPPPQAAPQPGPDDTGGAPVNDLANQWSDWVSKPTNRAALAQFGIAMLQPVRQGETGMSHFANAVGYGGEAASNVQQQALKEKQVEDTSQLHAAQAELAGTRASVLPMQAESAARTAEARAQAASAGAENAALRTQLLGENTRTLRDIQKANAYQHYVDQTTKQNSDPLNTAGPQPIMDRQTWEASQNLGGPAPGADVGLPVKPPGQGVKPTSDALIKSSPNLQALMKLPDADPRKAAAIERARSMVSDPLVFDKMVKGQSQ